MPRLDNSDGTVIEVYDLEFDESDPDKTPPVDLCNSCACTWLDAGLYVEHPSYDNWSFVEWAYHCFECDRILTEAEDG